MLLGLKAWDAERHTALTGKDIGPTLDFARRLARAQAADLGPLRAGAGLTDDTGEIDGRSPGSPPSLGNVERVEVLPFHQMGRFKWEKLGLDYTLEGTAPPSPEAVERACDVFKAAGLTAY